MILGALGTKSLVAPRNELPVRAGKMAAQRDVAATPSLVHGRPPCLIVYRYRRQQSVLIRRANDPASGIGLLRPLVA
jgi:hypothetical protein